MVEVYQVSLSQCLLRARYAIANFSKNVCGVSVLDDSFEKLKRLNLAEIYDPTPKEVIKEVREVLAGGVTEEIAPADAPHSSSMDVA